MTHPDPEQLLLYAEGAVVPANLAEHIASCGECRDALAELGRFETQLAASASLPAGERAALRATTERLLATPSRRPTFRFGLGFVTAAIAAGVLATLALWPSPRGLCELGVRRYEPTNVVRAERMERFAIDVEFDAPRWLAVWQLDATSCQRLMPHADPLLRWLGAEMPLQPGKHRVPAAEVLDFEFAAARPPEGLVVVAQATEWTEAQLVAIEQSINGTPRPQLAAALQRQWPEAWLAGFPGK